MIIQINNTYQIYKKNYLKFKYLKADRIFVNKFPNREKERHLYIQKLNALNLILSYYSTTERLNVVTFIMESSLVQISNLFVIYD